MSLHHVFSDATASTIDITDRVRTPGPPATPYSVRDNAEEGSVSISDMTIDDPDGDLIITGHRRMYSYEDEAPVGDQLVHNSFTFGEKVIRGPNRVGAGRQWVVSLADVNTLLNRRVMNGADTNRPEETDTARMLALMGMTELNTVDDDSMISLTAVTKVMDPVDYRGQNVGQYIDDCRQASGKNAYVWYNEATGEYGLWYDFDYSTEFDSECFLTTDESQQVDYVTVFGYSIDRTWFNFDPSRVVSGGYMTGPFGTLYDQNPTTITNFAAIDRAIPAENVKTLTAAQSRMDRYLDDASTEELIIHTVMTKVPRSKVNAVKKGYLVKFKAEWGPGLEAYVQGRVLYRHVTEITEDPIAGYEIEMDISPVGLVVGLDEIIATKQDGVGNVGVTWEVAPVEGQLLVACLAMRAGTGTPALPSGWSQIDTTVTIGPPGNVISEYPALMAYKYATAGETISPTFTGARSTGGSTACFYKLSGYSGPPSDTVSQDQQGSASSFNSGNVTPGAGVSAVLIGFFACKIGEFTPASYTPGASITEDMDLAAGIGPDYEYYMPRTFSGHRVIASTSGSYSLSATASAAGEWCGMAAIFEE